MAASSIRSARKMTDRKTIPADFPAARPASVTIYDIAERAGVHPSTVSRALHKPGRVSAVTRRKVDVAVSELKYIMNPAARALPTGRVGAVGLIVPDLSSPSYFRVIRGVERAAAAGQYTLILAKAAKAENGMALARMKAAATDGLIVADSRLPDDDIRQLAHLKPVVVLNRKVDGVQSLVPTQDTGITEAVRHLDRSGHKRITYLREADESWLSSQRWESIVDRCSWSGLGADRMAAPTATVDGGRAGAREVLRRGSTAVICFNDLMAIGLVQELQATGVRVPEQISIIGFDNHFGSDFASPPLTTINSPLEALGDSAFHLITSMLSNETPLSPVQELGTGLIIRGSTGTRSGN